MKSAEEKFAIITILFVLLFLEACTRGKNYCVIDKRSELRIAFPTAPFSLDPHVFSEEITNEILLHIFDPLVFMGDDGRILPWVAKGWETPDPLTWIFYIRPGIYFQDNTPLTAKDVVYSVERLSRYKGSMKSGLIFPIKSVRQMGPYIVEIRTYHPYMPLLSKLTQIMIVPSHYYGSESIQYVSLHPIGSGAYYPLKINFKKEFVLKASKKLWHFSRIFRRIKFVFENDHEARSKMLINGKVDFTVEPSPDLIPVIRKAGGLKVISIRGARIIFLGLSYRKKLKNGFKNPFHSSYVRKAISMAINRKYISNIVMKGFSYPATQMVPPLIFGYAPDVHLPEFDRERAETILKREKFPFSKIFDCYYPADKYYMITQLVLDVKRQLKEVGINIQPVPLKTSEFFKLSPEKYYDCFISGWLPTSEDVSDIFEICFHSGSSQSKYGSYNTVGFSDKKLDALIERSSRQPTEKKRLAILQLIMKKSVKQMIWIPLVFLKDTYALRKDLVWRPRFDRYVLGFQFSVKKAKKPFLIDLLPLKTW